MSLDLEALGRNIDRLMTVEFKMQGMSQGVMEPLYAAAREHYGRSLAMLAAERLQERVKEGDVVFLGTGAGIPPYLPHGETDGPPGLAALARILALGLGAKPVYVFEEFYLPPVAASNRALGLKLEPWDVAKGISYAAAYEPFELTYDPGGRAAELVAKYRPAAVIMVERTGPNSKGIRHSSLGKAHSDPHTAHLEALVQACEQVGALSVGIGDNGNEIGYGVILPAVRKHKAYGAECQCPCGAGIATVTGCDVLVTASVSNWGAYAVEAALAVRLGRPDLIHDGDAERRSVDQCSLAGAPDGATGLFTASVDGGPMSLQVSFMEMLRTMVNLGVSIRKRDY